MFGRAQQIAIAALSAILILFVALSMYEHTLERIDRENQEELTWRCNGNGGVDTCQLLGAA